MKNPLRISVAVAALALLAGCAVSPTPASSPTSSAPSPSPTPTADLSAKVAIIHLGPKSTDALNADGKVLYSVTYDEDPHTVLTTLTAAIGEAPTPVKDPSDTDSWGLGSSFFTWGDHSLDLSLYEGGPGSRGKGESIYSLTAIQPTVNEIVLEGPSHISVGRSASETEAVAEPIVEPPMNPGELPLGHWTRPAGDPSLGKDTWTDWVVAVITKGHVSSIRATAFDYGA